MVDRLNRLGAVFLPLRTQDICVATLVWHSCVFAYANHRTKASLCYSYLVRTYVLVLPILRVSVRKQAGAKNKVFAYARFSRTQDPCVRKAARIRPLARGHQMKITRGRILAALRTQESCVRKTAFLLPLAYER